MLKDFIHLFVLSCDKASYLVEKQLQGQLTLLERLQLRVHLGLCSFCADYSKKAELIDKLARLSIKDSEDNNVFTHEEIKDCKKKIRERIDL